MQEVKTTMYLSSGIIYLKLEYSSNESKNSRTLL